MEMSEEEILLEIVFPGRALETMNIEGRDEIEDPLDEALQATGIGEVTGGGAGEYGANIDVEIVDSSHLDIAVSIIRQTLRDFGAPASVFIRKPDPPARVFSLNE